MVLNDVQRVFILLKVSLLLTLLPASASAMSFSNLQLTTKSFSVDITGNLPPEAPSFPAYLFITNPTVSSDPGFVTGSLGVSATAFNFSGSQTASEMTLGGGAAGDYFYVRFQHNLVGGDALEGTLDGSWTNTSFDPSAVTSLNFYWGTNLVTVEDGELLGSASLSAVPDTGSTAALLGAGVFVLAAARRRLG